MEIKKKIRKSVQRIGFERFFAGIIFLIAGLVWRFFYDSGDKNYENRIEYFISFWSVFWALWVVSGFLWWVFSGFKSVYGLVMSMAGAAFLAETLVPGVVFNFENGPYLIILFGLIIFILPRRKHHTTAHSFDSSKRFANRNRKSNASKVESISVAEQKRNEVQL